MSSSKNHRRGNEEKNRRGRLAKKASSFHGRIPGTMGEKLPRPMTVPDLISGRSFAVVLPEERPKLTKLLLNVTIQRSLGAVQVVMPPESTVGDLIGAALRQYAKEGRRPIFASTDASGFDLHYSQFSLESLEREEKLMTLGSRNFFLCPKKPATESGGDGLTTPSACCSKQAEKATKSGHPWLKFMEFMF
uniref:DUF7054 domain-containing protein n=1 Tax=Davidia involucrata TaxID=16924 RepID=A0A5B7A7F1_DAVIN